LIALLESSENAFQFVLYSNLCYNEFRENLEITTTEENMFGLQGIGLPELIVVLVIVLIIFGASRLREIGGALGGAISEFRQSVSGEDEEDKEPAEGKKEQV
jgi:sec-independent protein translocase protein TatA